MAEPQPPAQRPLNVRPQDAFNEVRREMPLQNAPAVVPVDNPPPADVPAANNAPPVENPGAAHVAPPLEVHNLPCFLVLLFSHWFWFCIPWFSCAPR